jgi:hypothetical protein
LLEDLSWEDETRLTFIELSILMDKVANPLDAIIDFAWASGADLFFVNNAKDELKRLRKELETLKSSLDKPVAYAKSTDDGWMYDLNIKNNPYDDQTKVVPLYKINHG